MAKVVATPRRTPPGKYAQIARYVAAQGAGAVVRGVRSGIASRVANAISGGSARRLRVDKGDADVITTQHDTKVRYMKGRQSRKQKRRVRFMKQVRRALHSDVGLRSFVSDDGGAIKTVLANAQGHDGAMLGAINSSQNDEILKAFQVAYETPAGTISSFTNRKVFIKSMCLDLHITNSGSNTAEIDVYQLIMRKDYNSTVRLDVMYTDTYNEQPAGSGFSRTLTVPGVTPFQNSNFCEHWNILSKRTIMMSPGQVTSLQLRIGRPRQFDGKAIQRYSLGVPGYTKGYLLVYRGAPRNNAGAVERGAVELTWTQERTMTVARNADGQNADIAVTV